MKRLALLMTVVGLVALSTGGCDSSKEKELKLLQEKNQKLTQRVAELESQLESLQNINQKLTQHVAELEGQLKRAKPTVSSSRTDTQASTAESIYIVVEGDSLWNIAEKQLGDGTRYTEILTLNPQIKKDKPLFVGTKLKMPPK